MNSINDIGLDSTQFREQCSNLYRTCMLLKLNEATTVYTMVYFFRFAKNVTLTPELLRGLPLISMAALLIATKFKEQPRKIRDIVNVYHIVVGKDSSIKKEQFYSSVKEAVLAAEQTLLCKLNFTFHVDVPHGYMLNVARMVNLSVSVVQRAWRLLNQSLICYECEAARADVLAVSCLYMSYERSNGADSFDTTQLNSSRGDEVAGNWWEQCDISMDQLQSTSKWIIASHQWSTVLTKTV